QIETCFCLLLGVLEEIWNQFLFYNFFLKFHYILNMAFTLWNLFEATVLCLNAVCILNEERFLSKVGWSAKSTNNQGFGENPSAKSQIFNLIHSIRTVTRIPLIFLNVVVIVIKLILG
ncbi:unnamed protein product, partial [Phaedon cochleariae]